MTKSLASSAERGREILAARIGEGIVNIAHVLPAKTATHQYISPAHTVISRLAYDYSVLSLPLQDLDAATAGELVFSTLFRRRDAHEFNRAYVDGLPVFYDHNVAFGAEYDGFEAIETFFSRHDDEGFAGRWRAFRVGCRKELELRFRDGNWGARHFYFSEKKVRTDAMRLTELLIRRLRRSDELICGCHFESAEEARLRTFLTQARCSAFHDVDFMLEHVFK